MEDALRNKLHEYIDIADERKLKAIYVMLEQEIEGSSYSPQTIEEFHKRRNNYQQNPTEAFSVEESLQIIRSSRKS